MCRLPTALAILLALAGLAAQDVPPTKGAPPASAHAAPDVRYVDVTDDAGLSGFRHVSGGAEKDYIIETTGSGVAMVDFDRDGFLDLYFVNGSSLDRMRQGVSAPKAALFRNTGDGTFRDVTDEAGVANERWGQGVCAGDFDNDGALDFYVTNVGQNRLYRGTSGTAFVDEAVDAKVGVDGWSTGCAFGDYNGDGWLDLYVAGYVDLDIAALPPVPERSTAGDAGKAPTAATPATSQGRGVGMGASYSADAAVCTYRGVPVMCGPRGLKGARDYLFRNNGDGTFTDVTREAGVWAEPARYGLGVAWFDMDNDGQLDVLVANDSGPNHLFRNLGTGRFEDVSYVSGAALDGDGRSQAHMGVAIGDFDNDGHDDIHITNFADDFNALYRNHGDGSFTEVSARFGVAAASIPFLGWGTHFVDYDNDGWRDLLAVNGHVYPAADALEWNNSYAQRALLYRNLDGKKLEEIGSAAGPALLEPRAARGSAVGDFDNDGGVDVAVNTLDGPPLVARNAGDGRGHWLTVELRGDPEQQCPRDAIGSVVFVTAGKRRLRGEVASGRSYLSQSDLRVHFGLGAATTISRIEVRWANGPAETYPGPSVDSLVVVDQARGVLSGNR
ncbi:MAG: CRTAC1 family protein [Luteitalea sp.]|nr:CRTAC1 family protein [Luteitalea sp.]